MSIGTIEVTYTDDNGDDMATKQKTVTIWIHTQMPGPVAGDACEFLGEQGYHVVQGEFLGHVMTATVTGTDSASRGLLLNVVRLCVEAGAYVWHKTPTPCLACEGDGCEDCKGYGVVEEPVTIDEAFDGVGIA